MARAALCAQDLIDTWQGDDVVPRIVERQVAWINLNADRFDEALLAGPAGGSYPAEKRA
jgi:hypothetical protein